MAVQADIVTELLVLTIGDGAGPEVFTPMCSFAAGSRGFEMINEFSTRMLADCVTPTNPLITKRAVKSQDWSVDADGTCNVGDDKTLADWCKAATAKNIKIYNNLTGGVQLAGSVFLERFAVQGQAKGESVNVSIRLVANGAPTITAVA